MLAFHDAHTLVYPVRLHLTLPESGIATRKLLTRQRSIPIKNFILQTYR